MYEGYTEAVREELTNANIVVDRFHVTQHYSKAADQLRQQELRRLKKELPEEEYRQLVEGFNNKIKVLKRRCYGIFNIQHIFQRIYLDLEGYRLFAY